MSDVPASRAGAETDGLRKAGLVARLGEVMADLRSPTEVIRGFRQRRVRLEELRLGDFGIVFGSGTPRGRADPTEVLVRAGLVLRVNRCPKVPREVAVAARLVEHDLRLTGRPTIAGRRWVAPLGGRRAVGETVPALLNEAGHKPVAALKKGGAGTRERGRLAKHLGFPTTCWCCGSTSRSRPGCSGW